MSCTVSLKAGVKSVVTGTILLPSAIVMGTESAKYISTNQNSTAANICNKTKKKSKNDAQGEVLYQPE